MKRCLRCGQEGHTSSSCRRKFSIVGIVKKFGRVFFKCLTDTYVFIYLTPCQIARRS